MRCPRSNYAHYHSPFNRLTSIFLTLYFLTFSQIRVVYRNIKHTSSLVHDINYTMKIIIKFVVSPCDVHISAYKSNDHNIKISHKSLVLAD